MDLAQIKAFIDAMASSDLAELEATKDGWTLRLVRKGTPVTDGARAEGSPTMAEPAPGSTTAAQLAVCAPLSGIVYLRPSPDQPPFVMVGQAVKPGTTVCVVEAMKTFNEVRADRDGVISAILVEPEAFVEAGQPLIHLA